MTDTMSDNDADARLRGAISRALDDVPAATEDLVGRICNAVYGEVVAGASVDEMSKAMGQIRVSKESPTYAAMGRAIWQIRYDRATAEIEAND